MTLLATTELEAVNIMLAAIQEAPVSTLAEDTLEDAQIALSMLRQVTKEVQTKSYHFNTDYDYPLTVDANNKIPIPNTAAFVDPEPSEDRDLVNRGGFFWDRENKTFTFAPGTTVKCRIVWMLDYEDLPMAFRTYVAMEAANRFGKYQMGDEATSKFTEEDLARALSVATADDLRRADLNMLRDSRSASNILRRRRTWQG